MPPSTEDLLRQAGVDVSKLSPEQLKDLADKMGLTPQKKQYRGLYGLPPELYHIPDDDAHYEQRKQLLKKHQAIVARLQYAFNLLGHTSWWIGWRGTMLPIPRVVYGTEIRTAAVSLDVNSGNVQLWFNGDWASNLSAGDLAYVYAHEVLHAVYEHMGRRKSYPKLWNIVCDAFINEYLDRTLKWNEGTEPKDRLDYVLKDGVRWKSLPSLVQKQFPMNSLAELNEYSADQIYLACLDAAKQRGLDLDLLKKGFLRRKPEMDNPSSEQNPPAGKPIRKPVEVNIGDLVRVKSSDKVGKIKSFKKDSKGKIIEVEVDVLPDDEVKKLGVTATPTT